MKLPFRIIDLSVPLEHLAPSEPMPAEIHYVKHDAEGRQQMELFFGVKPEDLVYSGGLGWAVEQISAITHTGTHVDAPYHYGPTSEGRPARTEYEVETEFDEPVTSLLTCRLETGRTHQIRVHLNAIGHSVVGDGTYGGKRDSLPLERPFLHAAALGFDHPRTGERVRFEEPLPAELAAVLERLSSRR